MGRPVADPRRPADPRHAARLDGRRGVVPVRRRRPARRTATCSRSTGAASARATRPRPTPTSSPSTSATSSSSSTSCSARARAPIDLLGHSMGGNVAMLYAGTRPEKVRRLVNLEGFGMPRSKPSHAPGRMAKWLDELKTPMQLRPYADVGAVADRLTEDQSAAARRPRRLARRPVVGADRQRRRARPPRRRQPQADEPAQRPGRRLARVLQADHGAAALDRGRPQRRQRLVGQPLHQGRVPRAAERRRRRRSATSSARPATCSTTTAPRTSPGCSKRSCQNRALHEATRPRAPPWTSNTSMPSATAWPT